MNGRFHFRKSWGAEPVEDGARFRLWAPAQQRIALRAAGSGRDLPMREAGEGWFEIETDAVRPGEGYAFVLPDGMAVADPAARAQMGDVHGPSRLVDPAEFEWSTGGWRGRPWEETVFYELHVGAFSPEGTFDGVARRLDHLADTGVTAIELMPVAQFGGNRGWGYDGVLLYAPHVCYGGSDGLKRLVDAAHERELMVFLDVVYNHFGPDGNYLHLYAPDFFHPERHTPWGSAIAYEKPPVRAFFIENALYWLEEYQLDGLRLDAIDQIADQSEEPLLEELVLAVRRHCAGRRVHLTTEDDRNIVSLHERGRDGSIRLYSAEWNDDFHHAAHVIATGEHDGYYRDYSRDPVGDLARALATGFVYQGEPSPHRDDAPRGIPSAHLPPTAFVDFLQNHDQVGNRAFNERLATLAEPDIVASLTAVLLLSPHIPLLFMGEEWAETRPFAFFTDFHGELGDLVREGRRREFAKWLHFSREESRELIPDPNAEATFEASRLDWEKLDRPGHRERLALVKRLLQARRRDIVPILPLIRGDAGAAERLSEKAFRVTWQRSEGGAFMLYANLNSEELVLSHLHPSTLPQGRREGTSPSPLWGGARGGGNSHTRPRRVRSWRRDGSGVLRRQATSARSHLPHPGGHALRAAARVSELDRLAATVGVEIEYLTLTGEVHRVSDRAKRGVLKAMGIAAGDDDEAAISLAGLAPIALGGMQAPDGIACFIPDWLKEGRCWGVACQLYGLRSPRNAGIGDFEDLARFAEHMAEAGADFVGVNPLHALFLAAPERCSPFSPSSRRFLNPLYIAFDKAPFYERVADALEPPAELRASKMVDYRAVGAFKTKALGVLFRIFANATEDEHDADFEKFVLEGGEPLYLHALFEALSEAMTQQGHGATWHSWPDEYRHPATDSVRAFAEEQADLVTFHSWLQWLADRQLGAAQARARAAGMRIGLYLDLAVGVAPNGSATWSDRTLTVPGARIGAPPDYYNAAGQDWGLAPLSPAGLVARNLEPFRDSLDAVLHHAGALRIDHAMSLYRLFWIADGFTAADGVYVRYPFAEMLQVLAGVSRARQAIIIGEDLGVVPPGFRDVMRQLEIQSYRVFFFEKRGDFFLAPDAYPREALACITTHDLHTLAGWWTLRDIDVRREIGMLDAEGAEALRSERAHERRRLLGLLQDNGLLPPELEPVMRGEAEAPPGLLQSLAVALHRLVARTPSRLFAVPAEDLTGSVEQVNVPGTVDEHPNWRRKLAADIEDLPGLPLFRALVAALREERPKAR